MIWRRFGVERIENVEKGVPRVTKRMVGRSRYSGRHQAPKLLCRSSCSVFRALAASCFRSGSPSKTWGGIRASRRVSGASAASVNRRSSTEQFINLANC